MQAWTSVWTNPNNMHHKILIIDEQTVVLGSYNFSKSAETQNDENTLIVHNEAVAETFVGEFQQIFDRSHR
jgi:phosphatidylserine/phosphatidylglycerophosphate/cardiolipin synthase-like enzyme